MGGTKPARNACETEHTQVVEVGRDRDQVPQVPQVDHAKTLL